MKYILNADEMKKVDEYSISGVGIPSVVLMERAALSVTGHILEQIDKTADRKSTLLNSRHVSNS